MATVNGISGVGSVAKSGGTMARHLSASLMTVSDFFVRSGFSKIGMNHVVERLETATQGKPG